MAKRLKSYVIFALFVLGLVFLGFGCTGNEDGKDAFPAKRVSSEGAGSKDIFLKGSDTVLPPLAQAEAEDS